MSGFILSHRKIWDNPIFKGNALRVGVWDWMLKAAAWKDTTQVVGADVIEVQRGQLCVSQAQICEATGITRQQLRTLMNLLEKTHTIHTQPATKATKGRTLITICKYEEYQSPDQVQQPSANQAPTKRQPTKERREQGKEEEGTNVPLSSGDDVAIPANDLSHAVSRFNAAAEKAGWPQIQKLNPTRTKQLRARLKDCGGVEGWEVALRKAFDSDFCRARTAKPWTGFSFDWLIRSASFTKLMEGNYDNRDQHAPREQGPGGGGSGNSLASIAARRRLEGQV